MTMAQDICFMLATKGKGCSDLYYMVDALGSALLSHDSSPGTLLSSRFCNNNFVNL